MRNTTILHALVLTAVVVLFPAAARSADGWYSIQVRAVPLAELDQGMATYRELREKGYLVYAYRAEIDDAPWLRIAVGAFSSRGAAAAFGRLFSTVEEMDHFVTAAPVHVLPSTEGREFVITPSALWVRGTDGARETHAFSDEAPNRADLPTTILPEPSPDGDALAYVYGSYLYIATPEGRAAAEALEPGTPSVSADADYPWRPAWSASGDYVAFLDQPFWEYPIGLWMARADGDGQLCLACNRDGQSAVKWFAWHPSEDRLFFVEGFAYGTIAIGGGLFSAEMDGTVTEVSAVQRGEREEIAGPLRIEDGRLHYRRVRWLDENYETKTIADESIPVSEL